MLACWMIGSLLFHQPHSILFPTLRFFISNNWKWKSSRQVRPNIETNVTNALALPILADRDFVVAAIIAKHSPTPSTMTTRHAIHPSPTAFVAQPWIAEGSSGNAQTNDPASTAEPWLLHRKPSIRIPRNAGRAPSLHSNTPEEQLNSMQQGNNTISIQHSVERDSRSQLMQIGSLRAENSSCIVQKEG